MKSIEALLDKLAKDFGRSLFCFILVYKYINSTLFGMRESITQEFEYGCGVACYAFALRLSYRDAAISLGEKQASSTRFWVKNFAEALNKSGKPYIAKYVKPHLKSKIYIDGTIVLIRRSKNYPVGHYLIRYKNTWMDPWINLSYNHNIEEAKSGFRKRLPGSPMYALFPEF